MLRVSERMKREGVLDLEEAVAIFEQLADMPDIAFGYTKDGCYARAHIMCQRLMEAEIYCGKAWAEEGRTRAERLKITLPGRAPVDWGWHVAPAVPVKLPDGAVKVMVFDPSLFDGPVFAEDWARSIHTPPGNLQITHFKEKPRGFKDYYLPDRVVIFVDRDARRAMRYGLRHQEQSLRTVFATAARQQVRQEPEGRGRTWRSVATRQAEHSLVP